VLYACESCGRTQTVGRSCGNRHCPTCQQDKTHAWLEKPIDRLLPCPYFLVTFTLPAELRALARSHRRVVYAALFEASSEALRALAADPKFVGTDRLGFFGVLHTWGRTPWATTCRPLRGLKTTSRTASQRACATDDEGMDGRGRPSVDQEVGEVTRGRSRGAGPCAGSPRIEPCRRITSWRPAEASPSGRGTFGPVAT
jgi:hypothetical protein